MKPKKGKFHHIENWILKEKCDECGDVARNIFINYMENIKLCLSCYSEPLPNQNKQTQS
jgi:hypothetical protein